MARKMFMLLMLMVVAAMGIGCTASRRQVVATMQAGGAITQPAPAKKTVTPVGCDDGGPKYFDSASDCESAMQSRGCSYYTPVNKAGYGKNPVDDKKLFLVKVEEPVCVQMQTVKGNHWVAQPTGTEFRFGKEKNGEFKKIPSFLNACGNPVTGIVYPSPKAVETPPSSPPASAPSAQVKNFCTEGSSPGIASDGEDPGKCYASQTWWEANRKTVAYGAVGVVAVGVAYCALSGRCGFWKHGGGGGGAGASSGGGGGRPAGAFGAGGPFGGLGTR